MKINLLKLMAPLLLISTANAGMVLDIELGAGVWKNETSGTINYQGGDINLKDDLGIDDDKNMYMYLDVNHFIPILPNIRIERQELKTSGTKATNITFAGTNFSGGDTVSDLNLTQNDLILYWGIPGLNIATAGIVNIDFGIDVKQYDGSVKLTNTTAGVNEKVDLNFIVPLAYLAVQIKPPFIPVTLSASTKIISYEDSSISDSMIKASIELPIPFPLIDFKLDIAYKVQKFDISKDLSDNISGDLTTKGMMIGLSAKF